MFSLMTEYRTIETQQSLLQCIVDTATPIVSAFKLRKTGVY